MLINFNCQSGFMVYFVNYSAKIPVVIAFIYGACSCFDLFGIFRVYQSGNGTDFDWTDCQYSIHPPFYNISLYGNVRHLLPGQRNYA
jgi:hypothetical protein